MDSLSEKQKKKLVAHLENIGEDSPVAESKRKNPNDTFDLVRLMNGHVYCVPDYNMFSTNFEPYKVDSTKWGKPTDDKKLAHNALDRARRPGENPEDSAFEKVDELIEEAIDECEPGTERSYASYLAKLIESYAQNIREEIEEAEFQDQI